jgi:hypothetical protein
LPATLELSSAPEAQAEEQARCASLANKRSLKAIDAPPKQERSDVSAVIARHRRSRPRVREP